jgi:hypothetical protein
VAGVAARLSELPQENQDVLKKLREMDLGAHIDHAPKLVLPKPVRVSQADSMPLDSDSAALMRLSLNWWGFPCPTRHLQIYHKYKGKGVPFPPDFRAILPRYRDPTI